LPKKKSGARRQQTRTRHRTSAAAARARQQRRTRGVITGVVASGIVLALVGLMVSFGATSKSTSTTTTSSTSTSTTSTPLPSAAGKPCVAMKGPLPKGAPAVPVETGPAPTKLVTKDLTVGTGPVVKAGAALVVDYIGVSCSTGKIFDSSYSRGQPASFSLSGVIPGWQQGIPGMRVGGERLLGIPPALAYGSSGQGTIAPNETLWFVVHVRSAK
jgi:peptidylprolyl isomerase